MNDWTNPAWPRSPQTAEEVSSVNIRNTQWSLNILQFNESALLPHPPYLCSVPRPNWPFVKLPCCGLLTLVFSNNCYWQWHFSAFRSRHDSLPFVNFFLPFPRSLLLLYNFYQQFALRWPSLLDRWHLACREKKNKPSGCWEIVAIKSCRFKVIGTKLQKVCLMGNLRFNSWLIHSCCCTNSFVLWKMEWTACIWLPVFRICAWAQLAVF